MLLVVNSDLRLNYISTMASSIMHELKKYRITFELPDNSEVDYRVASVSQSVVITPQSISLKPSADVVELLRLVKLGTRGDLIIRLTESDIILGN